MKPVSTALRSTRLFRKYFYTFIYILLVSFLFLGSVMLLFASTFWLRDKQELLRDNTIRTAAMIEELYQDHPGEPLNMVDKRMITTFLQTCSDVLDADFFLCNAKGEVVGCAENIYDLATPALCVKHSTLRLPLATAALAMANGSSDIGNPGEAFGEQMVLAFDPFFVDGKSVGVVVAAQPVNSGLLAYMAEMLRGFLLASMAVFLVDFIAVYLISYRLVRPVGEMVRATKKYATGDFSHRVHVSERDEMSLLAESFNAMAESLASLENSRRSFVANVSHELRTPMTTIGGFIDGMRDGTIAPEDQKKYLKVVSGEVKRLSRLVTGMLNLSRIEAGELDLKRVSFDISELLFTTALSFEQIIAAKHIGLQGLDALKPLPFFGDKDLLTQVFYNLLDNAVKFTPEHEHIHISADLQKDEIRVMIRNTGVGIAQEEIEYVFERFYKTDQSRSHDVKGAGLGLHLAKTIVKMHGGKISAQSDGENYTRMIVRLPRQDKS